MIKSYAQRIAGPRRRRSATALALTASLLVVLALASSASAAPKGIFAPFVQCPTSTPGVARCFFGQTTSGEFVIGSTKVPITKTITIQAGGIQSPSNFNEYFVVPAKNGETLSKTELNVPGGLLNLINCTEIKGEGLLEKAERGSCKAIFENGTTGVTATTEPVATETNPAIINTANILFEEKTAIVLPVRVHLKNPLLGEGCYLGSTAHPVQLNLTTGTTSPAPPNKPIKGKAGTQFVEEENEREVIGFSGNSLVDNSFSVPVAEGCGGIFSFLIDPILDAKIGLPSPDGHNTAILNGSLKTASSGAVIASEKF